VKDFVFVLIGVLLIGGSFLKGFLNGYSQVPNILPESTDPNGLKEIMKVQITNGFKEGKAWVIRTLVISFLAASAIALIRSWLVS